MTTTTHTPPTTRTAARTIGLVHTYGTKGAGVTALDHVDVEIEAGRFRTQEQNRADARARLVALLSKAAEPPPKPRRATKPSKGAVERRLKEKAGRSGIKKMRGKVAPE